MAKRNKAKFASKGRKSALRIEALEQRQLLATITGSGDSPASYQNIVHSNGNVYDQVLMTGASVTVTADPGQVTRVSFLDTNGDIVQAEFGGAGKLTISLDQFKAAAEATTYNQPGVKYVSGLASFTIQGSDATTNFSVFSVGSANAANAALFAGGKTGGNHLADVARLLIVADPQNEGGFSTFGGIKAGNAVFSDSTGVVGISANAVNVQGAVSIGDIDASNAGVPTLRFGANSQFATVTLSGGDLVQANNSLIQNGGFTVVNSQNGTTSAGVAQQSKVVGNATVFQTALTGVFTLDTRSTFDLTGMTQAQITDTFSGRTFTSDVTIAGALASGFSITAAEFRGSVTFNDLVTGTVTVDNGIKNLTLKAGSAGAIKAASIGDITSGGNVTGAITAKSIGNVTITGTLTSQISTDYDAGVDYDDGEKAIGNVSVSSNMSGRLVGVLGIGNVTVGGNLTNNNAAGTFQTISSNAGDAQAANIGTISITGDVNQGTVTTGDLIQINRGTFGDVTVLGKGTLNGTDLSVANRIGGIEITALTASTGKITVTDEASLALNRIAIGSSAIATSTLGDISLTSGSKAQTTNSNGSVSLGNSILMETGSSIVTSAATGAITLAGAEVITVDVTGARLGAISASTIASSNAKINVTTVNGTTSVASLTLNAGTTGNVAWNGDVGAVNGLTTTSTVGAVTVTAATTTFATDKGIVAKGGLTSLTINGNATFGATATPSLDLGGTSGALTFNGTTTMTGGAAPTIRADNLRTSLDSIGSITFNGRVITAAADTDIRASTIGDITVKAALNQGEALVKDLSVLANNSGATTATGAETVSRDGSNLASFSIGNVTVQSTNTIGVTGTQLFAGANSFFALGKIGNISLQGGGSAAVQTSLFGAAPAAGVGATFSVGDGDGVANNAAQIDFDGDGAFALGTNNTAITLAMETTADVTAGTVSIGSVSINAAGAGDSITGAGGNAASNNDGLLILAGVKATAGVVFDPAALSRIDNEMIGTISTISITNLSQQLQVFDDSNALAPAGDAAGALTTPENGGVIAAAGNLSAGTTANIGTVNGVTADFDDPNDKVIVGDANVTVTLNEIVVIRI